MLWSISRSVDVRNANAVASRFCIPGLNPAFSTALTHNHSMMNNADHPAPLSNENPAWSLIFAAWLVAASASGGALFFSEVMRVAPCVLCWYQRIFMFPLVLILPLGLFPLDHTVARYGLALGLAGWLIAAYHQLLMFGLIPERLQPCTQGVPCSEKTFEWFGFVTIPTLSLLAFSVVLALLMTARSRGSQ